jgi:AraC family transcriptional regulator
MHDGTFQQLNSIADEGRLFPKALLGVCKDFESDMSAFTYMIAAEDTGLAETEGMEKFDVPPSTWAVFDSVGPLPGSIQTVWQHITSNFFSSEPYAHAPAPDIEVYLDGNTQATNYHCEVWIPVIEKLPDV